MSKATKQNIKQLLDLTGATHEQLGRIAGVGRSTVSHWVSGKSEPRMGPIQRIADHYGLAPENIIFTDGMRFVTRGADGRLHDDSEARMSSLREYVLEMSGDSLSGVYDRLATVRGTGSEIVLSDEEAELVSILRSMNASGRGMVLATARAYACSGMYAL